MKIINLACFLSLALCFSNCDKANPNLEEVIAQFEQKTIEKIHYEAVVKYYSENNKNDTIVIRGEAFMETRPDDSIFGYSFFGKRFDFPKQHLYTDGNGFEYFIESKKYSVERNANYHFLGKPGGQLVNRSLYELDSIYESSTLDIDKNNYKITFHLKDNFFGTGSSDLSNTFFIDKTSLVPVKIVRSGKDPTGKAWGNSLTLSKVKINEAVSKSIQDYIQEFSDFEPIIEEEPSPNKLLNKPFPVLNLPNINNPKQMIEVKSSKLILLDFWEFYCGPCIKSFPKVEKLKNKYADDLDVFAIMSKEKEIALEILKLNNVSITNLIGNNELHDAFDVRGFPTYFLIDKNGIIRHVYTGFSEMIETDINNLLSE